ncbi:cytochrome c oxidase assembly protein PET191-domain-containing protein [Microdochium trichocladiopsis]|uniref:Cytochrome c oxidase assembly protein PET191-domain-containing protein n=1 Tax=Microdochium trichocladiopsis TaxID=1682393 RepID=A0A9P9BTU0_9PEZI|nr:cytochrome c oxidase assembly protein PET191-domain-containing protein [Microdochium trichocladiopsis]KAH7037347.1 cytochrome c oxidase assembly protein PET191-domain-containing protein [Microdochium trichocladiopsis]
MPSSCKEIRAALAQCLQESECVMIQRNSAADCLRSPLSETLPTKCQQLKKGYGECRRGMVDMRKRFRGNQPITFKSLESAESSGEGYQLYAGKSAFSGSVRKTDGNEPPPRDWRDIENENLRHAADAAASEEANRRIQEEARAREKAKQQSSSGSGGGGSWFWGK